MGQARAADRITKRCWFLPPAGRIPGLAGAPIKFQFQLILISPPPHQVHYAKPQQNDNSGLAVLVRQTKPKYTAGDVQSVEKIEGVKFYKQQIRDVPFAPLPFGNSSFYPGRPWRCQLPSQLEASSSCCPCALVLEIDFESLQVPNPRFCLSHPCSQSWLCYIWLQVKNLRLKTSQSCFENICSPKVFSWRTRRKRLEDDCQRKPQLASGYI